MQLRRKISLGLILVGFLLICYPLFLTVATKQEENNIRSQVPKAQDTQMGQSTNPAQTGVNASTKEQPYAILQIPQISLNVPVVAVKDISVFDTNIDQLPAHYPGTANPGDVGNIAIAGHVNGPAGFFARLKDLKQGDYIILRTAAGQYKYQVERVFVVKPNDWSVINKTNYEALTLTTCERVGFVTSAKRLIVRAKRAEK